MQLPGCGGWRPGNVTLWKHGAEGAASDSEMCSSCPLPIPCWCWYKRSLRMVTAVSVGMKECCGRLCSTEWISRHGQRGQLQKRYGRDSAAMGSCRGKQGWQGGQLRGGQCNDPAHHRTNETGGVWQLGKQQLRRGRRSKGALKTVLLPVLCCWRLAVGGACAHMWSCVELPGASVRRIKVIAA